MEREGKYIYCIIGTRQERNFGAIGIGGRGDEVLTIGYEDLSMVVSNHPMTRFVVNRDNMFAHERVIEEVMKEFDGVLPVRFGTVAKDADEIRNMLDRRYREFKHVLRDMDHKVELGVKGLWNGMESIYGEIGEKNKEIRQLKETLRKTKDKGDIEERVELGRMVEQALYRKRKQEAEKVVEALRRTAYDFKMNNTVDDRMFINAAFLVDKGREKEFDNIMDDMSKKYKDSITFTYVGPLPVFNFVNIVIYPEAWEK